MVLGDYKAVVIIVSCSLLSSFYFIMRSEVDKLFYELMEYSPKKKRKEQLLR